MTVDQYISLFFRVRGRASVSACPTHLRPKVEAAGKNLQSLPKLASHADVLLAGEGKGDEAQRTHAW